MPFFSIPSNIKQLVVLFLSVFFLSIFANAQQNYYFYSKATTEGNGTKQQPFRSLQKLTQLAFKPGDTIFFYTSDTLDGNIVLNNINGTKQNPIVFTSYGNAKQKCVINGKNKEAFVINSSGYFTISNLVFIGAGRKTGNTTDGIKLVNCKNAEIKNVEVSGFQKSGVIFYNCQTSEINNVYAHENGFAGILVEGDYQKRISNNIHIINCRADNNPGDPTNLNNHSGNGILVGNCKSILIEYCTATNNGWDMPRIGNGPVGIWAYEADSIIIQYCISYKNKTAKSAADGGGFDLDGGVTNSIIQYCLSYENWGSGYGIFQYNSASNWNNNTVRYCISINDGKVTDKASSMLIWNGWNGDSTFTNFYAYNNFFYNDAKCAFGFLEQSQHKRFSFFNNVFVAADTSDIFNGIDSSTNDIFLGNVWMKVNGGFSQNGFSDILKWATATGYEQRAGKLTGTTFQKKLFSIPSHIGIADPYKLVNNSLLLSLCNPALLNKGINIEKNFGIDVGKTDFFSKPLLSGNGFEPGICELK
jgi:hypothetical protein